MPTIPQLESFVAVIRLGTVTAAAAELKSSTSTVSAHIARLEQAANHRLLSRRDGRFVPTVQGNEIARHALRVLAAHSELQTTIITAASANGRRRVDAPSSRSSSQYTVGKNLDPRPNASRER